MIKRIPYSEIDFEKYQKCLHHSAQEKYSASVDFLDICAGKNQWEILVKGDYEAVMPIPFIKKYGIKLVVNPKLCQQLGIFSKEDNPETNEEFLSFFNKNYKIWYYGFNEFNQWKNSLKNRKNFIIPKGNYEEVFKKYSPKRKRKLRLDDEVKALSDIKKIDDLSLALDFAQENLIGAGKQDDLKKFVTIFSDFYKEKKLHFFGFFYKNELINMLGIYEAESSVALLGTFNKKETIKINGSSVLVDYVIQHYVSQKDFDFEGSEVPSIEEFFRGFRPEERPYPCFENLSKNWLFKIVSFLKK